MRCRCSRAAHRAAAALALIDLSGAQDTFNQTCAAATRSIRCVSNQQRHGPTFASRAALVRRDGVDPAGRTPRHGGARGGAQHRAQRSHSVISQVRVRPTDRVAASSDDAGRGLRQLVGTSTPHRTSVAWRADAAAEPRLTSDEGPYRSTAAASVGTYCDGNSVAVPPARRRAESARCEQPLS
jgi:hypothetical protein